MKIAFMFAGQGAQYPGMGADFYEKYSEARNVFDEAGDLIKNMCFAGTAEELKETKNTQPCIYTMTMAAYETFMSKFVPLNSDGSISAEIAAMAGFSLGEYSALTASGLIESVSKGVEIMQKRGQWMGEAGKNPDGSNKGTMAAAIGDPDKVFKCVEAVRGDGILTAANLNAPTQTVVSGDIEAVGRFVEAAKAERLRVTPLAVSSAFHCEMMKPAAEKMKNFLIESGCAEYAAGKMQSVEIPVYSNYTAEPAADYCIGTDKNDISSIAGKFAELMALQLMNSVQWVTTVRKLIESGVDTFIEFGPGKTLTGLVKKTDKNVAVYNVDNCENLELTLEALKNANA